MIAADAFKNVRKLTSDNSPALLTAVGVVGTGTTALLSGRAALRYKAVLDDEQAQLRMHELTKDVVVDDFRALEKLKLGWTVWIPPVVSGGVTVGAIVMSHRIGTRRAAGVVAAYALSERAWSEYKDKVVEKLGEDKEKALRTELSQDRMDRNPMSGQVVLFGSGSVPHYDSLSGRYFLSDRQAVMDAQNKTNYKLLHDGYASLSDFYELLGLPATAMSEEIGWTSDKMLEVYFDPCYGEDGQSPCIAVNYKVAPIRDFDQLG